MDGFLKQILHFFLASSTPILHYVNSGGKRAPNAPHLHTDDFRSSRLLGLQQDTWISSQTHPNCTSAPELHLEWARLPQNNTESLQSPWQLERRLSHPAPGTRALLAPRCIICHAAERPGVPFCKGIRRMERGLGPSPEHPPREILTSN